MGDQDEGATLPSRPAKKRRWLIWLWLALLALLGAGAGLSYRLWQQVEQSHHALRQQAGADDARLQALQAQLNQLAEQLNQTLREQMQALQARQQQMEQNIADLYARGRQAGDREDQRLSETAYLLRVAQQRLSLEQNPHAALAALQAADARLQLLQDPRFLPVRKQLIEDLSQLQAITWPDLEGAALRLQHAAAQVDNLPLLQGRQQAEAGPPAEKPAAPAQGWDSLIEAVWGELKQLVVIRYSQSGEGELLAPEQRYFLSQNLRLKLEGARFALLRRNTGEFRSALQQALAWLDRYYDQNNGEVQAQRRALAAMSEMELAPALPDISRSLALLEQLNTPQPGAPEPP